MNEESLLTSQPDLDDTAQLESDTMRPPLAVSLLTLASGLLRRKRFIGAVTALAALIGVGVSLLLPVRFTATTRLLTPQPTQSAMALMMSQPMSSSAVSLLNATSGGFSLRNPNDLYIGLLHSRPIADAVIQQFGLLDVYRLKSTEKARKRLASFTSITSEKSGFLAISVTDRDKDRAARMANAYTDQMRALTKNLALTEASRRRIFYEGELKQATNELASAELALQQIQQKKGLVQLDAQAKALIEGIAELRAQVTAKEVQLHALRSYSTENNPDVQMAANQLSSLREQLAQMERRNHASSPSSGLGLQDVAGSGLDYLRTQHELQYRQALLDLLAKQYDAARIDEAKDAAVIQVVEAAIPPEEKSSPHRAQIVLICILIGSVSATLYVLLAPLVRREFGLLRFAMKTEDLVIDRNT